MYLPLQINLLLLSLHPSSSPFLSFTSLLCSDICKQTLNIMSCYPFHYWMYLLKIRPFPHITTISLSHQQNYLIIPEHHLIISCGQFFPMISKMSFQGSCSNQDPNQVHTLSLVAVFLHISVTQGLGGSQECWLLPCPAAAPAQPVWRCPLLPPAESRANSHN